MSDNKTNNNEMGVGVMRDCTLKRRDLNTSYTLGSGDTRPGQTRKKPEDLIGLVNVKNCLLFLYFFFYESINQELQTRPIMSVGPMKDSN